MELLGRRRPRLPELPCTCCRPKSTSLPVVILPTTGVKMQGPLSVDFWASATRDLGGRRDLARGSDPQADPADGGGGRGSPRFGRGGMSGQGRAVGGLGLLGLH